MTATPSTVVFDFDRTLTNADTVLGFLLFCHGRRPSAVPRLVSFLASAVLARAGRLDAGALKERGVRLFLSHLERDALTSLAARYSRQIRLNEVHRNEFRQHKRPVVVSASFREYLEPLFPEARVVASELQFENGRAAGVLRHCHGPEKAVMLREQGIEHIDEFYTDGIEDLPVVDMAKKTHLVRLGKIVTCTSREEFIQKARRCRTFGRGQSSPGT